MNSIGVECESNYWLSRMIIYEEVMWPQYMSDEKDVSYNSYIEKFCWIRLLLEIGMAERGVMHIELRDVGLDV